MLLPLMFLAAVLAASVVVATVLFLLLRLIMPLRRALGLAPLIVGSAVIAGGIGIYFVPWLNGTGGETLTSTDEVLSYFAGIAAMALCGAVVGALVFTRLIK